MQQFVYKNFVLKNCFLSFQPLKNSFSKIGNWQVVENHFPKKMNRDLLESNHFFKFGSKR